MAEPIRFGIMAFALEAQETVGPDGLQRATVWIPARATVLHLGAVPGTPVVAIYALAPLPPRGPAGEELPYARTELRLLEFIVATVGSTVPPKGYKFRAPVRTKTPASAEVVPGGAEGLIFLFEKESVLIVGPEGGVA
jgi:hypothetical protein